MSIALITLVAALLLLLAAGGVMAGSPAGRAVLARKTPAAVVGGAPVRARAGSLRVLGGGLAGETLPVLDRVILGRDPGTAHLVFPSNDMSVSRSHCEISYDNVAGAFAVRDLGSRNGTFLVREGGTPRRLSPDIVERLAPGDRLMVGSPRNSLVVELG